MEAIILFGMISIVGFVALICIRTYDARHKKQQYTASK